MYGAGDMTQCQAFEMIMNTLKPQPKTRKSPPPQPRDTPPRPPPAQSEKMGKLLLHTPNLAFMTFSYPKLLNHTPHQKMGYDSVICQKIGV